MAAPLRIRIKLNEGRIGIPLRKLSSVALETERFLDLVCADCNLPNASGQWLAKNFQEGSLSYDVEFQGHIEPDIAVLCRLSLAQITAGEVTHRAKESHIRRETWAQFGKIANHIDMDEVVSFAVYNNGESSPHKWTTVSKPQFNAINEDLTKSVTYHGFIQGKIHALYKEADYMTVRNAVNNTLVKCSYKPSQYKDIHSALNKKDALIHLSGMVTATLIDHCVESMEIAKIRVAPSYSAGDLDKFFGCAPNLTGKLSTSAYMAKVRSNGN